MKPELPCTKTKKGYYKKRKLQADISGECIPHAESFKKIMNKTVH